jgi:hypothetical protein
MIVQTNMRKKTKTLRIPTTSRSINNIGSFVSTTETTTTRRRPYTENSLLIQP